jgi:ferredoxin
VDSVQYSEVSKQYTEINLDLRSFRQQTSPPTEHLAHNTDNYTEEIHTVAKRLLDSGQVSCVIGYETGPRGQTRPAFVYHPEHVDRLVWNQDCTHNLSTYLREKLHPRKPLAQPSPSVAVVCKPWDSRAINMLLAENQFAREQVHVIGVVCPGVVERSKQWSVDSRQSERSTDDFQRTTSILQARCQTCSQRVPFVYDTLVGDPRLVPQPAEGSPSGYPQEAIAHLKQASSQERMEFWLGQFDRCLRCYACRQACPMCNCPTCLYERDDSLWVGMGIEVNEKRAFHLGRAYHLAGRCIGCDECERVCPVGIPISLINRMLAYEMSASFGYHAGYSIAPSPFVTVLGGEEG